MLKKCVLILLTGFALPLMGMKKNNFKKFLKNVEITQNDREIDELLKKINSLELTAQEAGNEDNTSTDEDEIEELNLTKKEEKFPDFKKCPKTISPKRRVIYNKFVFGGSIKINSGNIGSGITNIKKLTEN